MAAMVIKNELSILLSCARLALPNNVGDDPLTKARWSQTVFFLSLLAGKLNESWVLLRDHFIETPTFARLRTELERPALRALQHLEEDFSKGGKPIPMMRNTLVFHYDRDVMAAALNRLSEEEPIEMWITTREETSRYDLGSTLAAKELDRVFSAYYKSGKKKVDGRHRFHEDVTYMTLRFQKFLTGVLMLAHRKGMPLEHTLVHVDRNDDAGIPAFPAEAESADSR